MRYRALRVRLSASLIAAGALAWSSTGALAEKPPQPFDDDSIHVVTTTLGGADPLTTDRTVQHWFADTTNPDNGIKYRFSMVGVDPQTNGSATIPVDIIPIDVNVRGMSFNGSDRVAGVLASPLFTNHNFSWTRAISIPNAGPWFRPAPMAPFPLSWGNSGQILDATMRSQFNKVGSNYHVLLDSPIVYDPVTIDVAGSHGITIVSPVGVVAGNVDEGWFQARVQNLVGKLHLDPTHLAIFLTKDIVLYVNDDPLQCCVMGGHGAGHVKSNGAGSVSGNGNQPVQTFVWSSWLSPGLFGPRQWVNKDITGLTHEISEWAADPFNTNTVQPWTSKNAPQYGCSDLLEIGDPTFGLGFGTGQNTFDPVNLPNGTANPFRDGLFHVQDEVFLPWFMHIAPNTMSQRAQFTNDGRYTFMGDMNLVPEFHELPKTCNP